MGRIGVLQGELDPCPWAYLEVRSSWELRVLLGGLVDVECPLVRVLGLLIQEACGARW